VTCSDALDAVPRLQRDRERARLDRERARLDRERARVDRDAMSYPQLAKKIGVNT
jgi:hypothetical protein